MRGRESDDCVVPMKAGNAAGGKAITVVRSARSNTYRAQERGKCRNETLPNSGESPQGSIVSVYDLVSFDDTGDVAGMLYAVEEQCRIGH